MGLRLIVLVAAGNLVAGVVGASSDDLALLERVASLDTPALLVLFIVLLARGKLRWERELTAKDAEIALWREAALARTTEREKGATIAEAALAAARKGR